MEEELKGKYIKYLETENDIRYLDFGKWNFALESIDYSNYDYLIFTNDSYLIQDTIHFYFNQIVNKNVELYAYTDSSEIKYHYQSYLFSIQSQSIHKFINMYNNKKPLIHKKQDLIDLCEVDLLNHF
jgi:hypothetical protein